MERTAQRIAVKLFATPDPTAPVELAPFIPLFHRFIQQGSLEGLLIDVADYAHVPNGPGVLLVGHDVDYAIDLREGRVGLLTTRKRAGDEPLGSLLRDTLRKALLAARAIEAEGGTGIRFATDAATLEFVDRLAAPNTLEGYEAAVKAVEPVLREVFGDVALELGRARGEDARAPLSLAWTLAEAPDAAALLERLGGAGGKRAPARSASQSPWDISVEEFQRLRASGADFVLVDVRERHEYEVCNLGGELIPLGSLPQRMQELERGAHIVVHCKLGGRGAKAVAALREAGFANAWNLNGGIFAWIDRIDPTLERY